MTRLTRYRLGWLVVFVALAGIAAAVFVLSDGRPTPVLLLAAILVVPGRVQGFLWRDFFRGTRLLRERRFADAIEHLERFRVRVAARPALKRAIWLSWPGYSADIEAMTLTNLGAARLNLGEPDAAERDLRAAIALDAESALAWLNLGLLHAARQEEEQALRAFSEARRLGYRGGVLDQVQDAASSALARVEGRGRADSHEATT